ncbi:MAG: FkbM family methyltransferase [Phycisphaerales bacterium]|nr:FkbM family methyltransferase [Phycisphaerales bacterium]
MHPGHSTHTAPPSATSAAPQGCFGAALDRRTQEPVPSPSKRGRGRSPPPRACPAFPRLDPMPQLQNSRPFRSRAQNLEDIVLWRALHGVREGRYVDIGACDPRFLSVSRGFYEQGWRGVHFEPTPDLASRLRADRPDEAVHQVALSDRCGEMTLFLSPVEGQSTGIDRLSRQDSPRLVVPTRTLASFGSGWAGEPVHWMKIDVEGMEEAVLRGWDHGILRPWILVIEATLPDSPEPSHERWEPLVLAAGYRLALFDGLNRFYVAEERLELMPAVAAPANIFDLMAGCRPEGWQPYVSSPDRRDPPGRRLRKMIQRLIGRRPT